MNNKIRIVFVESMAEDAWLRPVVKDVYKAFKNSEYDLFIVGGRKDDALLERGYVNVKALRSNYNFSKVTSIIGRKGAEATLNPCFAEATAIFKVIQPDAIIVWNGLLGHRAIYAKVAKSLNIPLYYAEKGLLPESWYIDPDGINPMSSVARRNLQPQPSKDTVDELRFKLGRIDTDGASAWEQPKRNSLSKIREQLGVINGQRIVFIPGQVDSDSNVVLFSNNFKDSLDALKWLVKDLPEKNFVLLVKPHPKGELTAEDFKRVIGNKGKVLSDINILDAIELADCIVTINSTVAFEAAIRAKPVLLLGEGVLSNRNFVSNYNLTMKADIQIDICIEDYNANKEGFHQDALSFAAYLDSQYYLYRNDFRKIANLFKSMLNGSKPKKKIFDIKEAMDFFHNTTFKNFVRFYMENFFNTLRCIWKK